jgi:hypothetical protein
MKPKMLLSIKLTEQEQALLIEALQLMEWTYEQYKVQELRGELKVVTSLLERVTAQFNQKDPP